MARQPPPHGSSSQKASRMGGGAKKPKPVKSKGKKAQSNTNTIQGTLFSDWTIACALGDILLRKPRSILSLMRRWEKPILKVPIPGTWGRKPSKAMLTAAKRRVLRFYSTEERLRERSTVVKAFYMASGEQKLDFHWEDARRRVRNARLDIKRAVDDWSECLAMNSGETHATSNIYVCGNRKITLRALTSLMCHEGLHNLARRTRQGNVFLSEDTEHIAMALLGDPQLSS